MLFQMKLLCSLIAKDWKLFLADRRAAVLCFVVPIVLASAFGMIFDRPSQHLGACKLPLAVVVEDESVFSSAIVTDLRASEHVEIRLVDRATAESSLNDRSASVALILPAGFGEASRQRARQGQSPHVELLNHPLAAMESQWAEGVLTEVIMKRAAREFLEPLGLKASLERPFRVERRTIPAESQHTFNSASHSFSGMTLQYLLFWGMECGLLLLRERQRGIWRRLRVTPAPLLTVLLGRAASTGLIALLQIAVTFGFGYVVFGVTVTGSWIGFLLLAGSISLLSAGVGLLVAAIGRTEASARSIFIVVILAVSMLGGLWLPAFLLPRWVQDWSQTLPTSWAMRGLDGVTWQGQSLRDLLPCLLAVNLFAFTFLALAIVRFHMYEARCRRGGVV